MAKTKLMITVDPSIVELLDKTGNRSAYLERIAGERWQEWTDALSALRAAGWGRPEVLAAADSLNGFWGLRSYPEAAAIALELHDAARLNDTATKWQVSPALWAERVKAIRESPQLAWALSVVVREFWSGNQECERRLEGLS